MENLETPPVWIMSSQNFLRRAHAVGRADRRPSARVVRCRGNNSATARIFSNDDRLSSELRIFDMLAGDGEATKIEMGDVGCTMLGIRA
jgi:hypothetical protein